MSKKKIIITITMILAILISSGSYVLAKNTIFASANTKLNNYLKSTLKATNEKLDMKTWSF